MSFTTIAVLISSLSFYAYCISYFVSPKMKNEFKRFNLEKIGLTTIILEFIGATGLLIGFYSEFILALSSLGLALLMLSGLIVRISLKDSLWVSIPAGFFMLLNFLIFLASINFF